MMEWKAWNRWMRCRSESVGDLGEDGLKDPYDLCGRTAVSCSKNGTLLLKKLYSVLLLVTGPTTHDSYIKSRMQSVMTLKSFIW